MSDAIITLQYHTAAKQEAVIPYDVQRAIAYDVGNSISKAQAFDGEGGQEGGLWFRGFGVRVSVAAKGPFGKEKTSSDSWRILGRIHS